MDIHTQDDDLVCRNAQVVKYGSFGMATLTVIALAIHQFLELPINEFVRITVILASLIFYANSFACEKQLRIILQILIMIVVTAFAWHTGGLNAPVMLMLITMPVLAAMTLGSSYIIPSLLALLSVIMFYTTLGIFEIALPQSYLPPEKAKLLHTNAMLMVAAIMGIACHFYELSRRRYQIIAETDGLTGVRNRRSFEIYLDLEWNRQQRTSGPVSMIMIDIDDFKSYNDRYGHLAGDDCLRAVAGIISHYTRRATEECFRYGGEEFSIILGNTTLEEALKTAEKIRAEVDTVSKGVASRFVQPVTLSAGVACIHPAIDMEATELVSAADRELYRAKQAGRNRVCSANTKTPVKIAV